MELIRHVFVLDLLYSFYCYLRKLFKSLKELASSKPVVVIQHFIIIFKPCRTCQLSINLTISLLSFTLSHNVRYALSYIIYVILLLFRGPQRKFPYDQKYSCLDKNNNKIWFMMCLLQTLCLDTVSSGHLYVSFDK